LRFWDSSAVVVLFVEQEATASLVSHYRREPRMGVWWGTVVECESAIARLVRRGELDPETADDARGRLSKLMRSWSETPPTDAVRQIARRLVARYPLRAADALQIAAALVACEQHPESLPFVCLDTRLAEAARREGFTVIGASA